MIEYKEYKLDNGLTVLANRDEASKMAAFNLLYKVGARNESAEKTGFAHLFEHLMFRGTERIPDFDVHVQEACGENNAFTNNDYTDYFITLPKDNIETAFWLESDRMTGLCITPEALETEKKVVIEEYNQRYLNQPYGDQWLLLRALAYNVHPYRWATIGITPEHIACATMDEIKSFYDKWYNPSNAILSVSGDIAEDRVFELAEKWFSRIPGREVPVTELPREPLQCEARRKIVGRNVPASMITVAFKMGDRLSREYYECDLISDLLAGGTSARLYQNLVKEQQIFSAANAYISGDMDPGLFIVTGQIHPGISPDDAEAAVWCELDKLRRGKISDYELEKVKNKFEAGVTFGEINVMNKALNLGFYNMLGDMSLLNGEVDIFRTISRDELAGAAARIFVAERSSTLIYLKQDE